MKNQFSKDYMQLIIENKQNNNRDKLSLKRYKYINKKTADCIPTKFKNFQKSIFSEYKSNSLNKNKNNNYITNKSLNVYTNQKNTLTNNSFQTHYSITKTVNNSNNIHLLNLFQTFIKNKTKKTNFLPKLNSIDSNLQSESSFKVKKNIIETYKKSKFFDKRIKTIENNKKINNIKLSSGNLIKHNKKGKNNLFNKSSKNLGRKKTFLNIHKKIDLLADNEDIINKIKEISGKNGTLKEKENQNLELLYSGNYNNYIFKIYKSPEKKQMNIKSETNNSKIINNNKPSKRNSKNCLNNFDPKIFISNLKKKIKNKNIGNSNKLKSKLLKKTKNYFENIYLQKNETEKQDILEKIKEKNGDLINKEKKEYIQKLIDEILYKINYKHRKTILRFYIYNLLISQRIDFHIHIKMNLIKHILNQTETEYENVYFINLIKYLLYPREKRISLSYVKNFKDPIFHKKKIISSFEKYIESNKNKIYYLFLYIKFLMIDSETILNSDKNNYKLEQYIKNEKTKKKLVRDNKIKTSIGPRGSKGNKTIIKYFSNSKLMNLNLTKSILNFKNKNFEESLKYKTIPNLKNIKKIKDFKKKLLKNKTDKDDNGNGNNDELINNKNLKNELNENGGGSDTKNDNEEVHERERRNIFIHFFTFVEFSHFDKLYNWLLKCSKYMDLNYKLDNGDTLLHLCVKYSVPRYIIEFLILHGININSQNNEGDTALHLAVKSQKYKIIDLLIKMGASEYIYNKMHKNCWECL